MKHIPAVFTAIFLSAISALASTSFNSDWLFLKADATNAGQIQFDDSAWRKLNVPHDWSIEGPFSETNKTGGSGAFLPAGVGWYRKHFSLPENASAKTFSIEFDGVMANSDVWINGFHLGHRPNGYVGLDYELTGHLNFGGDNVIAVRCDNSDQPASRFFAGAGIYRNVRLVESDAVHFEYDGIFVSTPDIKPESATVQVSAKVINESDTKRIVWAQNYIVAPGEKIPKTPDDFGSWNGPVPEQTLAPGKSAELIAGVPVGNPKLWDLDHPNLYRVVTLLMERGVDGIRVIDEIVTPFGIRDAHFEADTGFWLNGKNFKIKGVAIHEDGSAFGAAVPLSVYESRLKTLKSLGVNAIRTAHNPFSPDFLDLCDRMGFLVMDEMFDCWTVGKSGLDGIKLQDYHLYFKDWSKIDTADIVRRDRNHPSIILYSAGNEIHDTPNAELAKGILSGLVEVFHTNDPTRPVTQALFRPNASHDYTDGLADMLDVVGQNYRETEILAAHAQNPARKIIGTENHHDRATWLALRDNAPYAGQFLWTGIDYLGESRAWPTVASGAGLIDRTGKIKPMGYERQSWWSDTPMVRIARRVARGEAQTHVQAAPQLLADWTPEDLSAHNENVEIYSNCKTVELFLNGKSLGAKEINADAAPRNWTVPFEPGILRAFGRNESQDGWGVTDELVTASAPAKIILTADKKEIANNWNDVCEVRATITDENGIEIPNASDLVSFAVSGAGEIAAVDSADNASHESFQATERRAFYGECVAFVRADGAGKITLTANAQGLKSATIEIDGSN